MVKRINHISDFGSLGGVQSYLFGLKSFSDQNFEIFSTRKPIDIYNSEYKQGRKIRSLFRNYFSLLNKEEIFVIHNLILSKTWPLLENSLRFRGKPVIYFEHGIAWHNPEKNLEKYKRRISRVDCIIVNSKATALLLKKIYGINKKINVLKSPIYIYENNKINKNNYKLNISKQFDKKENIKLGYLGRLEKHKNPKFLLEIAKYLEKFHNLNIEVDFIGSGSQKVFLQKLSREMKVSANFLGVVDDRSKHVRDWDFAIFPSTREPLGLVQGEMALMNKLCLSSYVDGIPEVYPPSTPELLINMVKKNIENNDLQNNFQFIHQFSKFDSCFYPDIEDCAKKIIKLKENPKLYEDLLRKYKKFLYSNFSIEKHNEELKKVLRNYLME